MVNYKAYTENAVFNKKIKKLFDKNKIMGFNKTELPIYKYFIY